MAVAGLKGLLASPDPPTARFAEGGLKNLSLTPFSRLSGVDDPRASRIQVNVKPVLFTNTIHTSGASMDGRKASDL